MKRWIVGKNDLVDFDEILTVQKLKDKKTIRLRFKHAPDHVLDFDYDTWEELEKDFNTYKEFGKKAKNVR